jgi:hypothetical protein
VFLIERLFNIALDQFGTNGTDRVHSVNVVRVDQPVRHVARHVVRCGHLYCSSVNVQRVNCLRHVKEYITSLFYDNRVDHIFLQKCGVKVAHMWYLSMYKQLCGDALLTSGCMFIAVKTHTRTHDI